MSARCEWRPENNRISGWIGDGLSGAIVKARDVLVGDADISYSLLSIPAKKTMVMQFLGALSSVECKSVMDILPGGNGDPLVPIFCALQRIYIDTNMLPSIPDEKELLERLNNKDACLRALRESEDAFRKPGRKSPILLAHSRTSVKWLATVLRDYGLVVSHIKDATDPATSLDYVGFEGANGTEFSVRVSGPRTLVITQYMAHMVHLRLFLATRLFGTRKIHDYEETNAKLSRGGQLSQEETDGLKKWPPEQYILDWIRELDRMRAERAAPPTVHEFYYNSIVWSEMPLGYRAWIRRCSPYHITDGVDLIPHVMGAERYSVINDMANLRGNKIDATKHPQKCVSWWTLAIWNEFVKSFESDIRNKSKLSTKKQGDTSSFFTDNYFINWSEWGLPTSYKKLLEIERFNEPCRPLVCAIGADTFAVRTKDDVFVTNDARIAVAVWVYNCGPKLEGGMPTPTLVRHPKKD